MKKSSAVFLVLAVALLVSTFRLGSVTLFDVDEAVFAEATKEMVQSGDYITPTYNGEVRYDKPIFFYWLMALSYKIFGINEFGARFPSALAGILLAAALFFFVRHFYDTRKALYSALSMTASLYFFVYSRASVTDMLLTLFISLSLFSFYISVKGHSRFIYGFYVFSALAFLTKGLIGILFPLAVAFIFLAITEGLGGLKKAFSLKALLLFIIVGVPWYAVEFAVRGDEFFQQFFVKHHFKRYTDVISGHKGPFYYYIAALAAGLFPWIAFLPSGIRKIFGNKDSLLIFAGVWVAFIVIFFSFATTKLPDYVLSAIPAAAILIASGMMEQNIRWKRFEWSFIALVSFLICIAFVVLPSYLEKTGITDTGWMLPAAAVALVMAVVGLYTTISAKSSYGVMLCIVLIFFTFLMIKAYPMANQRLQGALYRFSLYAKEKVHGDGRIITYGINMPSIVFYSDRKVAVVRGSEALRAYVREHGETIAIAKVKDLEAFSGTGFTVVDKENGYALLERK
ncbi:MAG TPA: glycosyltransferase family 39 protein [Dissulfurispiraceae bacterium]|nr:glycosyltransferase family 39 protein [Dissulfurispiraceae bacterium]